MLGFCVLQQQWGDEHSQVFVTENYKENVLKNPENELYFTLKKFTTMQRKHPV